MTAATPGPRPRDHHDGQVTPGQAATPDLFTRWFRIVYPYASQQTIDEHWEGHLPPEREFWRELDAQQPQPAPELTQMHLTLPDTTPQPAPELAADADRLRKALENVFAALDRQTRTYAERISYARTLIRTALEGK